MSKKSPKIRRLSADEVGDVDFVTIPNKQIMDQVQSEFILSETTAALGEIQQQLKCVLDGAGKRSHHRQEWFSTTELTKLLNRSRRTIARWIKSGKFPTGSVRGGNGKKLLFNYKQIDKWLDSEPRKA